MADRFANAPESPATAAQHLPPVIRELHRAVLRRFLDHGRCHRDDLRMTATALGVELDDALYRLESDDLVHTAADGDIEVAYPFSGRPTTHTAHLTGRPPVAAMCAIDALGIPLMSGSDGVIYSADPVSQTRIQIRRHGSDWIWQPSSAVVVISRTDCPGTLADTACESIAFHTTAQDAQAHLDSHPELRGVVLGQADAIAVAASVFGSLLAADRTTSSG